MFYIIEQGARVETPINRLLQAKGLNAVSASSPVRAVGAGLEKKEPVKSTAKILRYQNADSEQPRSPAIYAHQIMTSPVVLAGVYQTVQEIWALFAKYRFHHFPLLDESNQLQGIVTDGDLLRYSANNYRDVNADCVELLMTPKVITAGEQAEIRTIAEVMCVQAIGAIPIVNEQVEVVGMVTRSDILRTLVHQAPLDLWT